MSQSHEWRKITHVSPTDMTQLCVFWITRKPLPRPVRRRAVEAGILHDGQPPMFTHEGTVWMLEHAPRSRWDPHTDKRNEGWVRKNPIEGEPRRPLGMGALMAAASLLAASDGSLVTARRRK